MDVRNLFDGAPAPESGETVETLAAIRGVRIERIASSASPGSVRFVQEQDEWVALLRGTATLEIDGRPVELRAGDHLLLPAGVPHEVRGASAGALWLAVHVFPERGMRA